MTYTIDDRPWVPWNPATDPKPAQGARIRHEYGFNFDLGRYFIHPDDAPADPDAEIADALHGYDLNGDSAIDPASLLTYLRDEGFDIVKAGA